MLAKYLLLAAGLVLFIALIGCGTGDGSSRPPSEDVGGPSEGSSDAQKITRRVAITYAFWGGGLMGLEDLVRSGERSGQRQIIVLGRVLLAQVVLDNSIAAHLKGETPAPVQPVATANPSGILMGIPFTHHNLLVERVIHAPGIQSGAKLNVSQLGAVIDGVAYEDGDDPIILTGRRYLLFLMESRPGTWTSHPVGRFPVSAAGRLEALNGNWEQTPAGKTLVGMTIDQAAAEVMSAMARTPKPIPDIPLPTLTPPSAPKPPTTPIQFTPPAVTPTAGPTPPEVPAVGVTPTASPSASTGPVVSPVE